MMSREMLAKARNKEEGLMLKFDSIYKEGKLYIPLCKRAELIEEAHHASSHGSIASTNGRSDFLVAQKVR